MRMFVGVTDWDWFRFLRDRPDLDELNFWQPSGSSRFRALQIGEPFLFKLHAPRDAIAGGGFFAHFSQLPYRTAWNYFQEKNGAASMSEMQRRIEKYRRVATSPFEDYTIGCIILTQPFFFDESDWIPRPRDFAKNIVRGKGYSLAETTGRRLWDEVQLRLAARQVDREAIAATGTHGEPTLIRPRLGQGAFRSLIADTYHRRCAITKEKALPALEAAHILPVAEGGQHLVENGLLLRSDVHRLFDSGYVTVTPDYRFRVSHRLKDDFDNGEPYYPFDGDEIERPDRPELRPNRQHLEWHSDTVFRR